MDFSKYKSIPVVLTSKALIDSSLSKTQRKTPTEVHKHFDISRIRKFYIRKIKFTQQTFHDKLNDIVEGFPKIENIHPFYADLINVLYDKDHYKIALGKVNLSKGLVDHTANEYIRLMKYGDSLFRCKTLKRIALGRMATIIKKLDKSLVYLEEVRKHMSRLPSIDPFGKTILLCGFPNVGKSSFLNNVSRANVEVEPYPFTTKSLYVGQTDYKYIRFQVIDTPGILDQPLENRNTIEMQSITALAHLKAAVIYMFDISETCGYSISEQIQLFDSLRPILKNKPTVLGLNKIDVTPVASLSEEDKSSLSKLESENFSMVPLCTQTGEGVMDLRNYACDLILTQLDTPKDSKKGKNTVNGLYVAFPKPRDNIQRPAFIPPKLIEDINNGMIKKKEPTEKDLKNKLGDDYLFDPRKQYLLPEEYKNDIIPEIINGKNISDFIDPNISEKLLALAEEEELRDLAGYYNIPKWNFMETKAHLDKELIDEKRMLKMAEHNSKRTDKPPIPRTLKSKSAKSKLFRKPEKSDVSQDDISADECDRELLNAYSETYVDKLKHSGVKKSSKNIMKTKTTKRRKELQGESGPSRRILNLKPKHLFSGKRKLGKTQRR